MLDTIQDLFEQKTLYHQLLQRVESLEALLDAKSETSEKSSSSGEPHKVVDFSKIKGIGKVIAEKLVNHGFHSFSQITSLSDTEIEELEEKLGLFKGKIKREDWVGQASRIQDAGSKI